MKVVVYTAIFGAYDTLQEPKVDLPDVDFICFTDQPIQSKTWQVRQVERLFEDATREARRYKVLPHKFLPEYDYSIWQDGNFQMIRDARQQIGDESLMMHDHISCRDARNCIYEEAEAILELGRITQKGYKDNPKIIKAQMHRYRLDGFPEGEGLVSSGIIYRKHHDLQIIKLMEQWWSEIQIGSKRDQLSFNYCIWKNPVSFKYIHQDVRSNRYFQMHAHNT